MSKRILVVRSIPNNLDYKGYNIQQVGLGRSFVDLGYDYDFITFNKFEKKCKSFVFYENKGCQARWIEKPRYRFLRWGINTEICQKKFLAQYDIIICQEYYQLESYLIARNSRNVALYSGPYYNLFLPKFLSPFYDYIIGPRLNLLVRVIFVKSVLAYNFLSRKGYTGIKNVGVALDTSRFEDVVVRPETQVLIDYMKKNRCLLYVGALSDRKNYPLMLQIYAMLLKSVPDLKFVVIGKSVSSFGHKLFGGKDTDYEENCMKRISKSVSSGIIRVERIENPQLKYIYPLCKAFLLPSKQEIFGMVLLEAMYLGAPVVTSMNGGSMTLIGNREEFGQIVEEFDVKQWAEAVLRYLNDESYTARVKENGRRRVKQEFSWASIVREMLEHLKNAGYNT